MAITVTISAGAASNSAVADRPINYVVSLTNTGSSAVTLLSLSVNAQSTSGAGNASTAVRISQPPYLTPNVPVGVGNPIINAAATVNYPLQVVFLTPYFPGPSPQNPGGASPFSAAMTPNDNFTLQVMGNTSDGSVFSYNFLVPVLSTIAPFPIPEGGALIFTQGSNIMNLIMLGAL